MTSKRFRITVLLLAMLLPARFAFAFTVYQSRDGGISIRLAGYVKTLALGLADVIVPGREEIPAEAPEMPPGDPGALLPLPETENTAEDFMRARLMLEGDVGDQVGWTVHYEHSAVINPVRETTTGFFAGSRTTARRRSSLLDLDWTVHEAGSLLWRHELDRLNVRFSLQTADVVIGRQAISWGVGRFWNPFDLFVAFSPVEIDREFKTGVDAASIKIPLGSAAQIETVYAAFDDDLRRQAAALRGQVTVGQFDLGMMGGKFFRDVVVGPFFDGEVGGVGVRGEWTFTHNTDDESRERRTFFRGIGGIDYRFTNGLYALLEYYYNGFGEEDAKDYLQRFGSERLARGDIYNVGQHYLGAALEYEPHPLVKTSLSAMWNLRDQSALVGPLCVISLSDEADLRTGAYFPLGTGFVGRRVQTEFGLYPQVYYLELRMYF